MYGLTRAATTLLGAAVTALLLWLAVQVIQPLDEGGDRSDGEYWTFMALIAAAGFVVALSQLLGGWTKGGWPRISLSVLLLGFLPAAIVTLWLLGFHQPGDNELRERLRDWSDDLGIEGTVAELGAVASVSAFALGLLFGLTFDTSGPRRRAAVAEAPAEAPPSAGAGYAREYGEPERVSADAPTAVDRPGARDDDETRVVTPPRSDGEAGPPPQRRAE